MKHIKCQNDWSIEVSKPFKMILKLSLLKKTKRDGFDGCYEWADYFDFAEVKQNIHRLFIKEMIANFEKDGSIRHYKPAPELKKYNGPKFDRYDYQLSRSQLINYLVRQYRKLHKQKRFINLLEDIDYISRNN